MTTIRIFEPSDWAATWAVLKPILRSGETYSFPSRISASDAKRVWIDLPEVTFVAEDDSGQIVGSYFLKPNQPGQGAHVCNCGYVVSESARGMGIASTMCKHSQQEAVRRHYRAMQYNLVVSSNTGAVRLWQKHGFEIVGTLPGAFRHPGLGYVDAHIMYKSLESQ